MVKFAIEHCPQKLAKISLECIYETYKNVKGVKRMLVPRRLNVYKTS